MGQRAGHAFVRAGLDQDVRELEEAPFVDAPLHTTSSISHLHTTLIITLLHTTSTNSHLSITSNITHILASTLPEPSLTPRPPLYFNHTHNVTSTIPQPSLTRELDNISTITHT